jgi:hypothetical protein
MALETNSQFDFFKQIQIDDDGNLLVSIVGDSGYTANYYTTGATVVGNTAYFDRNDLLSAYTLDLSTIAVTGDFLPLTGGTMSGITYQYLDAQDANQSTPDFILDGGSGATVGFELNINNGLVGGEANPDGYHPYKVDLLNSGTAYTFSGEINVLSIGTLTAATTVTLPTVPLRDFYVVKDKTGNAGTYPISISAGSTLINGESSYTINISTKPSITFLYDGVEFITI